MSLVRLLAGLIVAAVAALCFWQGLVVTGVVWLLVAAPLASRRVVGELVLLLTYLEVRLADEDHFYYWYPKARRSGDCEDVHAIPTYGSVQGRMRMNFWRPLTPETFGDFARAVRANRAWHNEK